MSSVPSTSIPQPQLEPARPPEGLRPERVARRTSIEPPLSLDERIRRAELRLIAREDTLKRRIDLLGRRLHEVTQARRFIAPAIGGALALFALWRLLRGRTRPRVGHASAMASAAQRHGVASELPWAHLLALAWPMLPAAWRARISPTTATTLVSVGLPLAEQLLARAQHRPLPTVASVDLARYAGTWHEIARLPEPFEARCAGQPSAHYKLHHDRIEVLNRCLDGNGRERVSRGVLRAVADSGNAKLQVTFLPSGMRWLPFAWADLWVLHLDDDYRTALVGHPNRRHLWVLSRSHRLPPEQLAALMQLAARLEFPIDRLQVVQPD